MCVFQELNARTASAAPFQVEFILHKLQPAIMTRCAIVTRDAILCAKRWKNLVTQEIPTARSSQSYFPSCLFELLAIECQRHVDHATVDKLFCAILKLIAHDRVVVIDFACLYMRDDLMRGLPLRSPPSVAGTCLLMGNTFMHAFSVSYDSMIHDAFWHVCQTYFQILETLQRMWPSQIGLVGTMASKSTGRFGVSKRTSP